jgi:hypothetical protein
MICVLNSGSLNSLIAANVFSPGHFVFPYMIVRHEEIFYLIDGSVELNPL